MPVVDAEGHLVNNLAFDEQLGRLDEPTLDAIRGEILRDLCDTNPQLRNRLAENTDTRQGIIEILAQTKPEGDDGFSARLVILGWLEQFPQDCPEAKSWSLQDKSVPW